MRHAQSLLSLDSAPEMFLQLNDGFQKIDVAVGAVASASKHARAVAVASKGQGPKMVRHMVSVTVCLCECINSVGQYSAQHGSVASTRHKRLTQLTMSEFASSGVLLSVLYLLCCLCLASANACGQDIKIA